MTNCSTCGCTRHPAAKPGNCQSCHTLLKRIENGEIYKKRIDELGFDLHLYDLTLGVHGKVKVTNRECGHMFTGRLNNIFSGKIVCGVCGPQKRMKHALKFYVEKHGRTYDLADWNDYKNRVMSLSNAYYEQNKHILNPLDLPRMRAGAHPDAVNVDHIIPMIYGFKNGLPIELLANPLNIRVISATSNLRKKQKLTEEAKALLEVLSPKHYQ